MKTKHFIALLEKNNIFIDNLDLKLLQPMLTTFNLGIKLAVDNRPKVWNEMDFPPKIQANRKVCILVKYGEECEVETVLSTEFEEFVSNHICLKWFYLDNLVNNF